MDRLTPDIVFYLAGADPFMDDRLGQLSLTEEGLAQRDRTVFDFFRDRSIPVATCMAGGYAENIEKIVDIHFSTVKVAETRFRTDRLF